MDTQDMSGESDVVRQEASRLWMERQSRHGRFKNQVGRLIVRTFRIVLGIAVGGLAYFLTGKGSSIAHRPIATLSIADLIGAIFYMGGAIGLAVAAFATAFGEYEAPTNASDFITQAREIVAQRRSMDDAANVERERVAKYYQKSKLWGFLHDPSLGFPGKPIFSALLWILLITAFYGLVGGTIWFFQMR